MYSAVDVANFVVAHENVKSRPITNLRLGKLLYFIQADFLVNKGRPCFKEDVIAWDSGPVVLEAYSEFKIYGGLQIPRWDDNKVAKIREEDCGTISEMLDRLDNYSTRKLEEIIKAAKPYIRGRLRFNGKITNESLEEYYG